MLKQMADFPKYKTISDARCFNCNHELPQPENSGYSDGKLVAKCPNCQIFTFYDTEEGNQ